MNTYKGGKFKFGSKRVNLHRMQKANLEDSLERLWKDCRLILSSITIM